MKVVLFCGGLGTRIRGDNQKLPKPLVKIGGTPLIECVMQYYAYHGHTEFILCLGYGAVEIRDYFRQAGGRFISMISNGAQTFEIDRDQRWTVALVDTGAETSIGQRLRMVERYIANEELFLANYADGLTDLHLPDIVDSMDSRPMLVGAMVAVKPIQSFHYVHYDQNNLVTGIDASVDVDLRINGGYFVFRREIFRYLYDDEDLLDGPFTRLVRDRKLLAHCYDGFWRACDTLKDVQQLEAMWAAGRAPWEVWRMPIRPRQVRA